MPDGRSDPLMKNLAQEGLDKAKTEYANREDEAAESDLEIEIEFWLSVDECSFCGDRQMCSTHYQRFYDCL